MKACFLVLNLAFFTHFVLCRDFYIGMFKKNDYLVAQDVVYKEASHFGATTASYGRLFKCPITYFRVVDRLGMGRGPFTQVVRGGLRKKFITVRIKSTYNLPISVNIYVGCANKGQKTTRRVSVTTVGTTAAGDGQTASDNGTATDDGAPASDSDVTNDQDSKTGGDTDATDGAEETTPPAD